MLVFVLDLILRRLGQFSRSCTKRNRSVFESYELREIGSKAGWEKEEGAKGSAEEKKTLEGWAETRR